MDEWTKEDVAKMEAEAEKEIETNFPSYFDEVQKSFFSGQYSRDGRRDDDFVRTREIDIEHVFAEFMEVSRKEESSYRTHFLKNRLEVVQLSLESDKFEQFKHQLGYDYLHGVNWDKSTPSLWTEDACAFL
jgi:hypothetical protein